MQTQSLYRGWWLANSQFSLTKHLEAWILGLRSSTYSFALSKPLCHVLSWKLLSGARQLHEHAHWGMKQDAAFFYWKRAHMHVWSFQKEPARGKQWAHIKILCSTHCQWDRCLERELPILTGAPLDGEGWTAPRYVYTSHCQLKKV